MSTSFSHESPSRDDLAALVDRAVADLLAAAGVSAPPVDALLLARNHLRLEVIQETGWRHGHRPRVEEGRIVVAADDRSEQVQWAVAGALGARCKPDVLRQLGIREDEPRGLLGVSLANLFAARLLLPTAWFIELARETGYDLLDLQHRFSTAGYKAIATRFLDLPSPCVMTQIEGGVVLWRRSNAWRVQRPLSWAEQRCRDYVVRHGEPHILRARGWTVQGWPIPVPVGTSEFLRSVIDEDAPLMTD